MLAHDQALTYGGRPGIVSLHLIQSAIGRPYSGYHLRLQAKAASLLQSLTQNHGFVDGNKRTAWILVELLITRSGYMLEIPDDEPIDDLVVAVVVGDIDFDTLVTWFANRLAKA